METETPTARQRIIEAYTRQLRRENVPPASVYHFTQQLDLTEKEFFQEFPSFQAVEATFWRDLVDEVATAVESGVEWETFTARQRVLTFFFAWIERTLEVRSLALLRFSPLGVWKNPLWLKGFNERFREFAKIGIAHGISTNEIAERGRLAQLYPDGLLTTFRSIIEFNLHDDSPGYERTDAFIEKSVNLAFDLIRTQALDSAFDLARFLAPHLRR